MGTGVLDSGFSPTASMHVYAQCAKGVKGGVALVVLNLDQTAQQTLQLPLEGGRYTLSAENLLSKTVSLNGVELKADKDGTLPKIAAAQFKAGAAVCFINHHLPCVSECSPTDLAVVSQLSGQAFQAITELRSQNRGR
jgi:hypothetical protein